MVAPDKRLCLRLVVRGRSDPFVDGFTKERKVSLLASAVTNKERRRRSHPGVLTGRCTEQLLLI